MRAKIKQKRKRKGSAKLLLGIFNGEETNTSHSHLLFRYRFFGGFKAHIGRVERDFKYP